MPLATPEQQLSERVSRRFRRALSTYHLIEDGDKVLVGLSGGKDSLCLLELLALRSRIRHPQFELAALHVRMDNIHYESDTRYLEHFAKELGVRLIVRNTRFDASTDRRKTPCFLCSWYRRKELFAVAQELGFNKLALGHHQDDIIHTALMNTFFQGQFSSMPVRLRMRKMPLTIIRPLCLEKESDIDEWARLHHYEPQKKSCPYEKDSFRSDIQRIFDEVESLNGEARFCVWRSLESAGKLIED